MKSRLTEAFKEIRKANVSAHQNISIQLLDEVLQKVERENKVIGYIYYDEENAKLRDSSKEFNISYEGLGNTTNSSLYDLISRIFKKNKIKFEKLGMATIIVKGK